MAYAVHINFNAPLGDEAAVAALFEDDTGDKGILDKSVGTKKRNPTQLDGPLQPKPADIRPGKIATGASTLKDLQERLAKAFCGTEGGKHNVPSPSVLLKNIKSVQMERGIGTKDGLMKKQAGGE